MDLGSKTIDSYVARRKQMAATQTTTNSPSHEAIRLCNNNKPQFAGNTYYTPTKFSASQTSTPQNLSCSLSLSDLVPDLSEHPTSKNPNFNIHTLTSELASPPNIGPPNIAIPNPKVSPHSPTRGGQVHHVNCRRCFKRQELGWTVLIGLPLWSTI